MSDGYEPGCLATICAAIAFFGTWIFAFVVFNFFGLVFGWIAALIVAVVVYYVTDVAIWLLAVFMLIIFVAIGIFIFLMA